MTGTGPFRRDDVAWVELDGEVVVVEREGLRVHVLSGAAAAVWQILDGESLDGVPGLIADVLGLGEAQAEADLRTALGQLEGLDLVASSR